MGNWWTIGASSGSIRSTNIRDTLCLMNLTELIEKYEDWLDCADDYLEKTLVEEVLYDLKHLDGGTP